MAQRTGFLATLHPGPRALIIGTGLFLSGSGIIAGLVFLNQSGASYLSLYLMFLVGALGGFMALAGPAYVILSAAPILAWIGLRFGQNVLMLVVLMAALVMTAASVVFVLVEMGNKALHPPAIIMLFSGTGACWALLGYLIRSRFIRTNAEAGHRKS
jgi:hypothetical protein